MEPNVPPLRIMSLHALAYCERLFYLEEVEEIRVADHRVYAGRTLHEAKLPADEGEAGSATLESEQWGLRGKVDYVRYRDGKLIPFEHKRGRSRGDDAWESDRLQVIAYAALLSEHFGRSIMEGRVRYHANNKTVRVAIDAPAFEHLRQAIVRARELSSTVDRPPIAANENLCARCSLAPVCLPEEERLITALDSDAPAAMRLFPERDERQVVHVTEVGSRVGKQGEEFIVTPRQGDAIRLPGHNVAAIVLHGAAQISSQAVHYALAHDVGVHWLSGGGRYIGGIAPAGGVQRRHRQFAGLQDAEFAMTLSRRLVQAKVENQLQYLLRAARVRNVRNAVEDALQGIRSELRLIPRADGADALRGHEGMAGRYYFSALPKLIDAGQTCMQFDGRNRRPRRLTPSMQR